ncbi:MAG: YdgA family protein [Gammaproteobacteria bacterium]
MKKAIVVVVILLAAILGLVPGYVGGKAEAQYSNAMERLRLNGLRVERHDYQRGWMGAAAVTDFVVPIPRKLSSEESIRLPSELRFTLFSDVQHGPLIPGTGMAIAKIDSRILLNGRQLFPDDYPATLQSVVALDGSTTTHLDLPEKTFELESGKVRVVFHGLEGTLKVDRTFSQTSLTLSSPGGRLDENGRKVADLGPLSVRSNGLVTESGLALGNGKFQLDALMIAEPKRGRQVEARGLYLDADSNAQGERVVASMTTGLESLNVAGQRYGASEIRLSLGNLHAPVLLKIQQALEELRGQNIDPQMQSVAIMSTLMTQAPLLLQHDPVVSVERLHVETPDGPVDGHLTVRSVGMTWEDLQGGLGFLQKLQAEASLSLPETLLREMGRLQAERQVRRQIEMRRRLDEDYTPPSPAELGAIVQRTADRQIAALLEEGLIRRKGSQLESEATFDQGRLTVNGKLIELPFLPPPR